ncbi:hypothetical protein LO772_07530 [Yinghuangia sp. ASG 101]|uniref:ATP-binding protein n=1 Tax=Yinghuangia sp. ASG 101 TaxID=2896848 RepID=UPI001E5E9761|nr:ATP-binding protein [Yinghuangia sp. ASG 101]UGQ13451.1 hypothetical protein LO772_07530 [Yinghuangia sp. ASG 101]
MDGTHNTISGGEFHTVVQARVAHMHAPQPVGRPRQRQLPAAYGHFVNRAGELRLLDNALTPRGGPTVVVLTGMGGVGKTATGVRWLAGLLDRFAGDHLYMDLRGHEAETSMSPTAVIDRFLRDLGVPPAEIPVDADRLPERFRSVTSEHPVIVFLDNVRTAAQVRPLMPGHPDSLVVVTSRHTLAGLSASHGAVRVPVRPLDADAGAALLAALTGQTESAPELARACAGLPIAMCAVAAQVIAEVHADLAEAAAALERPGGGDTDWEVLSVPDDDISVRAVFDASYRSLPAAARHLYRHLGVHPTPEFDIRAAAGAAGLAPDDARGTLNALVRASLLDTIPATGRFRMHDLVHAHAGETAAAAPSAERGAAVDRIVGDYLARAVEAERAVSGKWRHGPAFARPADPVYATPAAALDALERDRDNLVAVVRLAARTGRHDAVWQLCEALWGLFFMRRHFADWIETYALGVVAAEQAGDRVALARMRLHLGFAQFQRDAGADDLATAREGFEEALRTARAVGHARTVSSALESLGLLDLRVGDPAGAAAHFAGAVDALDGVDHPRGRALLTHHLGRALAHSGRDADAIVELGRARREFAALGDGYNEARASTSSGEAHLLAGRASDAVADFTAALPHMRDNRVRHEEARILHLLGDAHAASGAVDQARAAWQEALERYEELGDARAADVREALSAAPPAL